MAILEFGIDTSSPLTQQRYQDFFETLAKYQKDLNIRAISFWRERWQNDDGSASKLEVTPWLLEGLQSQTIVSKPLFAKPMKN